MGCPNLIMVTDHKLLVAILGDKELGDVMNMQLFRLKECMALWQFDIAHLLGKGNDTADAVSHFPWMRRRWWVWRRQPSLCRRHSG